MPDTSARLSMPYLLPAQAQKHVTHNEALARLDLLVQLTVQGFDSNTPPTVPQEGQLWALGPAPTGGWVGQPGMLAAWVGGAWDFITPQPGWHAGHVDGSTLRLWDGGEWVVPQPAELSNLSGVGVNAGYDSINRLSVSAPATLLNHEGAGHQLKLNKANAADTASLLFQTGFSGRAEMGTAGDDDFAIKVSADGSNWATALSLDATSGHATGVAVTADGVTGAPGQLMKVGDFGLGTDAGIEIASLDIHEASGFYTFFGGSHPNSTAGDNPYPGFGGAAGLLCGNRANGDPAGFLWQLAVKFNGSEPEPRLRSRASSGSGWGPWFSFRTTENTTVDANGFIKEASPIVRLFDSGIEEPARPVHAVFERLGTGHYTLSGVNDLSPRGWQIEIPQDANGNRLLFAETSYDAKAQVLTVRTSEIAWQNAWVAGAPKDIPVGRWVDLRLTKGEEPVDP